MPKGGGPEDPLGRHRLWWYAVALRRVIYLNGEKGFVLGQSAGVTVRLRQRPGCRRPSRSRSTQENAGNGKQKDSVQKETIVVSATMGINVENGHQSPPRPVFRVANRKRW